MAEITAKGHILIINFSSFEKVLSLVKEVQSDVSTQRKAICIIDESLMEIPQEFKELGVQFVQGKPSNERILQRANIQEASHAILLSKDPNSSYSDDRNLAITVVIESLNPKIFSIVEVVESEKVKQFEMAGCDTTVCVSEFAVNMITQELQDPGVQNLIYELTSNQYGNQIYTVPLTTMANHSYRDLVLWSLDHGCSVVGLIRNGKPYLNCTADELLTAQDKVVLIGKTRLKDIHYDKNKF